MSLLLAVAGASAPVEEAPGWAVVKRRRRVIVHGRGDGSQYRTEDSSAPAEVEPAAKAVAAPAKAAPVAKGYDGPSAKEIATAALLEASRRLSEDLAAKAAAEEQARVEAATAQIALEYAQQQAGIAAQAVRRTQDEEALLALLLAM